MYIATRCIGVCNDYAELQKIGEWINKTGEDMNLPASVIYKLDVCVDEALMNIINYAYDDDGLHSICVRLSRLDSSVKLEIMDDGKEFVPDYKAPPLEGLTLADAPIGGLGIHLIHSLMDECRYARDDNKNILTMTLRLGIELC